MSAGSYDRNIMLAANMDTFKREILMVLHKINAGLQMSMIFSVINPSGNDDLPLHCTYLR